MLQFRDNTNKFVMALGALLFLFISSSTQACVLADHDCASSTQINAPVSMQCHMPMQEQIDASSTHSHLLQASSHDKDGECCQLIPADLGDFAKAQVSNPSAQQSSPDWFHLQFASALYASVYSLFAQREIISPPSQSSPVVSSSLISSLNAGRAPPLAVA